MTTTVPLPVEFWRWLAEVAPSERAFYEAFFTWVYTPRAHADDTADQIIEEALAFTYHQQSVEAARTRPVSASARRRRPAASVE